MTQVIGSCGQARCSARTRATAWMTSPRADRRKRQSERGAGLTGIWLNWPGMGVTAAAVEIRQPFRDTRGAGAIVFDPARLRQAAPEMLDPGFWRGSASPVQEGGRGAAWFVRGEFGDAVLRHYRRGGLAARLGRSRYFWLGEPRVRCLAEFRLLAALRAECLPVPAPLLAG